MNRRHVAAALHLYRSQNHPMYWVHPINQGHQQFGEFNALYKDLRKYPGRFYTYYYSSHGCLCINLCINIYEFVQFLIIDEFYINYNISFVTSRYLATRDAIITIAYNFQTGVSTARKIIFDVYTAIWDVLAPIYMPVPSEGKWKSIADEFYERWNFHSGIGAIDGKQVIYTMSLQLRVIVLQLQILFLNCTTSCCFSRL